MRRLAYDLIPISFRPPNIALRGYMHSIARKCGREERPETPRGAVDSGQEACKEHLFTAKSRDYQRSQKGKERKKSVVGKPLCASSGCGTFSLPNPRGFSFCTYVDAPHTRPSRPNRPEFIAQQLQILGTMQAEQEQRERQQQMRKAQRPGGSARIPEALLVLEIPR